MNMLWLSYPPAVFWSFAAIFGLLLSVTTGLAIVGAAKPQKDIRELKLRTKTWWFIVGALALGLGSPDVGVYIFFGVVSFMAYKEYISNIPTRQVDGPLILLGLVVMVVQYYFAAHFAHHGLFTFFGWVFVPTVLVFVMVFAQQRTDGFLKELGVALAGFMITIYAPSHLAHFFALPAGANRAGAAGLVLFVVFVTQWNDVAQFCSGKLLGSRKILPKVSPNKTWEGFIGGVVLSMALAALLAPLLTPFGFLVSLFFGAVIAVLGFLGDVFISAIKRDLGVKDMSTLLPGHGGILDRIDSLILVAPVYFHLVYYFVYMKGGFVCSVVS